MQTLKTVLEKYKIEIPIIQRDYAQGRRSPRIDRLRENFIGELINSLQKGTKDSVLHLDFIYGREVDTNQVSQKKANYQSVQELLNAAKKHSSLLNVKLNGEIPNISEGSERENFTKILPLDGQQRLTTLWLLHFSLAHQCGEMPQWINRFSYETRKSSRDFIKSMIEHSSRLKIFSTYSKAIKNSEWFLSKWEFDPTVEGMLVTLDEIYKQSKYLDCKYLYRNLEENQICFDFLPLSELSLDNDIYIKMNARGKELSDFENFKNVLLVELDKYFKTDEIQLIAKKMDVHWYDIFWTYKRPDTFDVQTTYFTFVKTKLLYFWLVNNPSSKIDNKLVRTILNLEKEESKKYYLDLKTIEGKGLINFEALTYLFEVLDTFGDSKKIKIYESWLNEIIFDEKRQVTAPLEDSFSFLTLIFADRNNNIAYDDRAMVYAITEFLRIHKNFDLKLKEPFQQYIRVCQNLIYNQVYIQDPETFSNALKTINELAVESADIYSYILSEKVSSLLKGRTQFDEELIKLKLIHNIPSLEKTFLKAEKHYFLRGQIGFLIEVAGGSNSLDLDEFENIRKSISNLFREPIVKNSNYLLERAFLTYGNFSKDEKNDKWSFFAKTAALRAKEEGWRQVFRSPQKFKKLIKLSKKISKNEWQEDLQNVTTKYDSRNWSYYFIKSPSIWEICYDRFIKITKNGEKVRLLEKTAASSRQRELRSYYFKENFTTKIEPFTVFDYHKIADQTDNPCAFFSNWKFNKNNYFLDVRFYDGRYELRFGIRNQETDTKVFDNKILKVLNNHDFKQKKEPEDGKFKYLEPYFDNSYLKYEDKDETLVNEVQNLLKDFVSVDSN